MLSGGKFSAPTLNVRNDVVDGVALSRGDVGINLLSDDY